MTDKDCNFSKCLPRDINAVVFDLDGTIYLGDRLVDGALSLFKCLEDHSLKSFYITNNSSKSRKQLVEKLSGMGISLDLRQVYGAAYAMAAFVREKGFRSVFCIGAQGLREELSHVGVRFCEDEHQAEALIIGMDKDFDNVKLTKAVRIMKRGCMAIVCSRDSQYPIENGRIMPGCGPIAASIEKASGLKIHCSVGKPNRYMIDLLCGDWNLKPQELLVVGDTYSTDILMARRSGSKSILISKKKYKSTVVVPHLSMITQLLFQSAR